jgi:hypothetical protein
MIVIVALAQTIASSLALPRSCHDRSKPFRGWFTQLDELAAPKTATRRNGALKRALSGLPDTWGARTSERSPARADCTFAFARFTPRPSLPPRQSPALPAACR